MMSPHHLLKHCEDGNIGKCPKHLPSEKSTHNAWRTDSGDDLMWLSTALTTRLALARLSKSKNVSSTRSKTVRCSHSQKMYRVCVSAHNPNTPAGVTTPFENDSAGIHTASKHVRMRPQINQGAHQQIDQEFEENVFSLQMVHCLQSVERSAQSCPASSIYVFGAACTLNTC